MKNLSFLTLLLCLSFFFSCKVCPDCPTITSENPTINKTIDYKVPITSPALDVLYWQCGNPIDLDLPNNWKLPKISATNADVLQSNSDNRKFTIVPSGKTCVLNNQVTTTDGNLHQWDRKYTVIKPPKPEIELLVNGRLYNGASPISKKSRVVVRLKPNSDFGAALPKDARYQISRIDLLSQRSLGAPTKVGTYSGSGKDAAKGIPISLGNKLKQDTPGTIIYFKIDKVYRVNFQNKKVEEKFPDRMLYLSAVIK
jgi:hypothetical protein